MKKKKDIEVQYFFKKIKDTVYKYQRIGKGKWELMETPYKEVPYIYVS